MVWRELEEASERARLADEAEAAGSTSVDSASGCAQSELARDEVVHRRFGNVVAIRF
jgi:hypothetical protein